MKGLEVLLLPVSYSGGPSVNQSVYQSVSLLVSQNLLALSRKIIKILFQGHFLFSRGKFQLSCLTVSSEEGEDKVKENGSQNGEEGSMSSTNSTQDVANNDKEKEKRDLDNESKNEEQPEQEEAENKCSSMDGNSHNEKEFAGASAGTEDNNDDDSDDDDDDDDDEDDEEEDDSNDDADDGNEVPPGSDEVNRGCFYHFPQGLKVTSYQESGGVSIPSSLPPLSRGKAGTARPFNGEGETLKNSF